LTNNAALPTGIVWSHSFVEDGGGSGGGNTQLGYLPLALWALLLACLDAAFAPLTALCCAAPVRGKVVRAAVKADLGPGCCWLFASCFCGSQSAAAGSTGDGGNDNALLPVAIEQEPPLPQLRARQNEAAAGSGGAQAAQVVARGARPAATTSLAVVDAGAGLGASASSGGGGGGVKQQDTTELSSSDGADAQVYIDDDDNRRNGAPPLLHPQAPGEGADLVYESEDAERFHGTFSQQAERAAELSLLQQNKRTRGVGGNGGGLPLVSPAREPHERAWEASKCALVRYCEVAECSLYLLLDCVVLVPWLLVKLSHLGSSRALARAAAFAKQVPGDSSSWTGPVQVCVCCYPPTRFAQFNNVEMLDAKKE
jgi:hypothetical protein